MRSSSSTRSLTGAAPCQDARTPQRSRDHQGAGRRKLLALTALFSIAFLPLAADVNPDQYLSHVRYLASPDLKGRATGSPGLEKAAHYIAAQFRSFGLGPTELPFPATLGAHLGNKNHLKFKEPNEPARTLTSGKDFLPLS